MCFQRSGYYNYALDPDYPEALGLFLNEITASVSDTAMSSLNVSMLAKRATSNLQQSFKLLKQKMCVGFDDAPRAIVAKCLLG
jgi:hypothetical protein